MHRLAFVFLTLLVVASSQARGQSNPSVSTQTLHNLTLPPLVTGSTSQVLFSDPAAGKIQVSTTRGGQLMVSFNLPRTLSGAGTLPITFGANSAAWSFTDQVAGATSFDPNQGTTVALGSARTVFIWIGASASASAIQPAGLYAGAVTVTLAF